MQYDLTKQEWDFINNYLQSKGLPVDRNVTFGDIPMPDMYSEVRSRSEIEKAVDSFTTELYPGIKLRIPFVLANMVCVSDAEAIVAMEREGGLGIPPQMISRKERLKILDRVGRAESAYIKNPLTIGPNKTLAEAKKLMDEYSGINSLVVVDENKKPIGILSTRDWAYEIDENRKVLDLMGGKRKLYKAAQDISLSEASKILRKHRIEKLPLINRKGVLTGLMTAYGLFYERHHPRATRDDKGRFLKVGSIGVGRNFTSEHLKEVELQVRKGIAMLLIDTARAFSINTKEAVEAVKKHFPKLPLIVGNTSTPEGAKALFEWGADIVKVGIGPGEACRTREIGVGIPQLSAVAKCAAIAEMVRKSGRPATIIADGGMKSPGDVAKALIAGANAIMSGSMFIGTEESAIEHYWNDQGLKVKDYIGSASSYAQRERIGRGNLNRERRAEGVVVKGVPVIGTMKEVIDQILGGLASFMSYQGVRTVAELREKGRFDKPQSPAGLYEGVKKK
ncbi:MAG: IMP dehydrogenase [Patescibacteria group bacterium]